MSKKDKVKAIVDQYITIRKEIGKCILNGEMELGRELNANKHQVMQKAFDLLSDQEYNIISKKFLEITTDKISECSTKDMDKYLKQSKSNKYTECLDLQKSAMEEVIDSNIVTRVVIFSGEDEISVSEY